MPAESPIDLLVIHTRIDPRPYQTRIVNKTLNMFLGSYRNGAGESEPAARSVLIESPTGSGKSCMGLLVAKALQLHAGAKVGWVAMRLNLLTLQRTLGPRPRYTVVRIDPRHQILGFQC